MQWTFISGCPRSGTSITADLFRAHSSFGMGRERYGRYLRINESLDPAMFDKQRFCRDLQAGDSHHRALDQYYDDLFLRFDRCTHLGDKIPHVHKQYAGLRNAFPNARFIFLVRDVFDVANSFKARQTLSLNKKSGAWPTWRGVEAAVEEWNRSISDTIEAFGTCDIFVARYDRLFTDSGMLDEMMGFVRAPVTAEIDAFWTKASVQRQQITRSRSSNLSETERRFVEKNADFEKFEKLLKLQ
jgi:hypothetical protein